MPTNNYSLLYCIMAPGLTNSNLVERPFQRHRPILSSKDQRLTGVNLGSLAPSVLCIEVDVSICL